MENKFGNIYLTITIFFLTLFIPLVLFAEWVVTPTHKTEEIVYYVPEGSSLAQVTRVLSSKNILTHPGLFKLYARLTRAEKNIKPGTFVFTGDNSPHEILTKLVNGDTIKIKVVIPEGLNIYQISNRLADNFPKYHAEVWLKLMSDPALLKQLPVPTHTVKTVEGFLFPDTYFFDPNEKPKHVLEAFISHFNQTITKEMIEKANKLGFDTLEFITFASILQKESGIEAELPEISAVFHNRLRIRMRLQSDPTVIYGVWDEYNGKITKKHLHTDTRYNTYKHYGLPVGPIANPGFSSLQAALNPAQSKNLYFVASGDGTHTFSESYQVHKKAVKRYIQHLRSYAR